MWDKHTSLIQLLCGKGTPQGMEITMQNELQVLKVSCKEFCSYIVILILQVYSNIIKC